MKALFLIIRLFTSHAYAAEAAKNPWLGHQRALVLLLEWADKPQSHNKAEFESAFFTLGQPSISQFFAENSAGKFELTGEVMNWKVTPQKWNPFGSCDPRSIASE